METTRLKYFVRVIELGSVTKAAESLHVAQPALTRQIKLLEEDLGVELVHRHHRGIEPTEAGLMLYERAVTILRLSNDTRAAVMNSAKAVSGCLRIGSPSSVSASVIALAGARFRRTFPQASLQLQENYSASLRDALLTDRLDLAITSGIESNPVLEVTPLYTEAAWVFSSRDCWKPGQTCTVRDLVGHTLALPPRQNALRGAIEQLASEAGRALTVGVETASITATHNLLRDDPSLMALAPCTAFHAEVVRGSLFGAPLRDLWLSRQLVRRLDRPLRVIQIKFTEHLLAQVAALAQAYPGMVREEAGVGSREAEAD